MSRIIIAFAHIHQMLKFKEEEILYIIFTHNGI